MPSPLHQSHPLLWLSDPPERRRLAGCSIPAQSPRLQHPQQGCVAMSLRRAWAGVGEAFPSSLSPETWFDLVRASDCQSWRCGCLSLPARAAASPSRPWGLGASPELWGSCRTPGLGPAGERKRKRQSWVSKFCPFLPVGLPAPPREGPAAPQDEGRESWVHVMVAVTAGGCRQQQPQGWHSRLLGSSLLPVRARGWGRWDGASWAPSAHNGRARRQDTSTVAAGRAPGRCGALCSLAVPVPSPRIGCVPPLPPHPLGLGQEASPETPPGGRCTACPCRGAGGSSGSAGEVPMPPLAPHVSRKRLTNDRY